MNGRLSSRQTRRALSGLPNKRTMTGVNLELYSSGDSFVPIFKMAVKTFGPPPPNSTDLSNSGRTFILKNSSGKSSESSSSSLVQSAHSTLPQQDTRRALDIPDKLLPLSIVLKAQALYVVRQPDQRCLKEATGLLPLLNKMRRAQPQFRVGCAETLVALMHVGWNIRLFADLVTSRKTAIEHLVYQDSEPICINCCQGMSLDYIPAALDNFGRSVPSRVWYKATVCLYLCQQAQRSFRLGQQWSTHIYHCILIVHRTQDIEPPKLPFAALTSEY